MALKVNGPTWAMPDRWATKAKPQMTAVSSSRRLAREREEAIDIYIISLSL